MIEKFDPSALLVNGAPLQAQRELPPDDLAMFAAVSDQPGSALGIIYFARASRFGWPLVIVDWGLVEMAELTEEAIRAVFEHAQLLRAALRVRQPQTLLWIEEGPLHGIVQILARRAGIPTGCDLRRIGADVLPVGLEARAAQVTPLINLGRAVKLASEAYSREQTFRNATVNHLRTQLRARPGATEVDQSLAAAFYGVCCITLLGSTRPINEAAPAQPPAPRGFLERVGAALRKAGEAVVEKVLPAPRPAPLPPRLGRILLTAGAHVIDGLPVTVSPTVPGDSHGWLELPFGPHIIDEKIQHVHNPAVGVGISVGVRRGP